ncbi:hypothetical protein ACVWZW_004065 [Bradyrhizobium sp. F1.13.4]
MDTARWNFKAAGKHLPPPRFRDRIRCRFANLPGRTVAERINDDEARREEDKWSA